MVDLESNSIADLESSLVAELGSNSVANPEVVSEVNKRIHEERPRDWVPIKKLSRGLT